MTSPPAARHVEYMALDAIVAADVNPKEHDEELIGESIGRFGFIETPVIDERTGKLVGGHGRTDQLRRLHDTGAEPPDGIEVRDGRWHVPVLRGWASANDDEALAAGIALNRVGERGGWNLPDLYAALDQLSREASGLVGLGFSDIDVDAILALNTDDLYQGLEPEGEVDALYKLHDYLDKARLVLMLDIETVTRFRAVDGADDEAKFRNLLNGR